MNEKKTCSNGCTPNTFGYRLRKLRKDRKLNQLYIANVLGVSRSTLGKYETNDRFPSQKCLNQIADYFNVTIDYLLKGSNQIDMETIINSPELDLQYRGKPIDEVKRYAIKQILESSYKLDLPGDV